MRRQATRNAARAQGRGIARDIPVPLPLRGLLSETRTAQLPGVVAADLVNLRSSGYVMEASPAAIFPNPGALASRRIPYEFGAAPVYVEIFEGQVNAPVATLDRDCDCAAMHDYISGQMIVADGKGPPFTFDGAALVERTFTVDDPTVDPAAFDGVAVYQDRPYFWRRGGPLEFWYGDVGAVQGALTLFPLGRLGNITGSIFAMAPLTIDAAANINDNLAIFTSTGDIVMYEGLNPGDPEAWRLTARVRAAPPVGPDSFARVGGDIWVLTSTGLVSVLESIRQGVLALVGSVSRPVQSRIAGLVAAGPAEWQLHVSADGAQLIVNRYADDAARQVTYWPESQSWSETTYPARRWHNLAGQTEFTTGAGALGRLAPARSATTPRTMAWETSWFDLGRRARVAWLHPTIEAAGPLEVRVAVLTDHDATGLDFAESWQTVTLRPDDPADPGGTVALNERIAVAAAGQTFKIRMEITAAWANIVGLRAGVI